MQDKALLVPDESVAPLFGGPLPLEELDITGRLRVVTCRGDEIVACIA